MAKQQEDDVELKEEADIVMSLLSVRSLSRRRSGLQIRDQRVHIVVCGSHDCAYVLFSRYLFQNVCSGKQTACEFIQNITTRLGSQSSASTSGQFVLRVDVRSRIHEHLHELKL